MGDAMGRTPVDPPGVVAETGDLLVVTLVTLVAGAAILTGAVVGPVRVLFAAFLIGISPGYGMVSALFPARTPTVADDQTYGARLGHRIALAIPTSLVVLVLAAIPISVLRLPFSMRVLLGTVVALTVVASLVAVIRRYRAPTSERVRLPISGVRDEVRGGIQRVPPVDAMLNVLLAVAVVVAVGAFAVGLAAPDRGTAYSEVALLAEEDDELVAGNFTETYEQGEQSSFTLSIENQEGAKTTYTTIVALERVRSAGDERKVLEREVLSESTVTAGDGETVTTKLSMTPTLLGDSLRLSIYVYVGEPSDGVSFRAADYHLYRWIEVREPAAALPQPGG